MVKFATENEILTGLETNVVPLVTAIDGDPGGEGGDGGGCEGGLFEGGVWLVVVCPSELSLLHAARLSINRGRRVHRYKSVRIMTMVCRRRTNDSG